MVTEVTPATRFRYGGFIEHFGLAIGTVLIPTDTYNKVPTVDHHGSKATDLGAIPHEDGAADET